MERNKLGSSKNRAPDTWGESRRGLITVAQATETLGLSQKVTAIHAVEDFISDTVSRSTSVVNYTYQIVCPGGSCAPVIAGVRIV